MRARRMAVGCSLLVCILSGLCLGVIELKQSTARTVKIGPFVDLSNGSTAETALTIHDDHVKLSKNGAAFAAKHDANDLTHDAAGWYVCKLDTTDTATLGSLQLQVQDANSLYGAWHEYQVVSAQYYNNKYGSSLVQANVVALDGDATATEQSLLDLIDLVDNAYHPDINAIDVNDAAMATTTDIQNATRLAMTEPMADYNDGSLFGDVNEILTAGSAAILVDVNATVDLLYALLTDVNDVLDGADWNPWDAPVRTLTALDEDDTAMDLNGTSVLATATFDPNSIYSIWLVPWQGDPNLTADTMGGLMKSAASKR